MILALDPGTANLGWAVVTPRTGAVRALGVVSQEPDPKLAKSTDRSRRIHAQARLLRQLVLAHDVTAIAAEAASFNPRRFTMAAGLCMSIGGLTGVAGALELVLYEVPPKRWQHAVLGTKPGSRGKVSYDDVFARLAAFIGEVRDGTAGRQLLELPRALRNHALDAVGVGVFTSLDPEQATRIDP